MQLLPKPVTLKELKILNIKLFICCTKFSPKFVSLSYSWPIQKASKYWVFFTSYFKGSYGTGNWKPERRSFFPVLVIAHHKPSAIIPLHFCSIYVNWKCEPFCLSKMLGGWTRRPRKALGSTSAAWTWKDNC